MSSFALTIELLRQGDAFAAAHHPEIGQLGLQLVNGGPGVNAGHTAVKIHIQAELVQFVGRIFFLQMDKLHVLLVVSEDM